MCSHSWTITGLVLKTCEMGSPSLATDSTCLCQALLLGPTSLQPAPALRLPVFLITPHCCQRWALNMQSAEDPIYKQKRISMVRDFLENLLEWAASQFCCKEIQHGRATCCNKLCRKPNLQSVSQKQINLVMFKIIFFVHLKLGLWLHCTGPLIKLLCPFSISKHVLFTTVKLHF